MLRHLEKGPQQILEDIRSLFVYICYNGWPVSLADVTTWIEERWL